MSLLTIGTVTIPHEMKEPNLINMHTVVQGDNIVNSRTLQEIADAANATASPNKACAVIVFHSVDTASKRVLGGARDNSDLKDKTTADGKPFPQQIDILLGGRDPKVNEPMLKGVMAGLTSRFYLDKPDLEKTHPKEVNTLKRLYSAIENPTGWEDRVDVHTSNKYTTMCVVVATKHIFIKENDLQTVEKDYKVLTEVRKQQRATPYEVTDVSLKEWDPVLQNIVDTFRDDEVTRAQKAYDKGVTAVFTDQAVGALAENGAFQWKEAAQLSLSD